MSSREIKIRKTKKTQKVQYNEDDNHPVHSNEIGYSGVVAFSQGGSITTILSIQ